MTSGSLPPSIRSSEGESLIHPMKPSDHELRRPRRSTSASARSGGTLVRSTQSQQVFAAIPKFEVNPAGSLALGQRLQQMGMSLAFDRGKVDFTAIANPPDPDQRLYIGEVFHKAFVRVDEKGTEAAAATAVVMPEGSGAPRKMIEFKADHPFLFFIRDSASGLILFMGRVADPSQP
jgi:serine protease inhibitor